MSPESIVSIMLSIKQTYKTFSNTLMIQVDSNFLIRCFCVSSSNVDSVAINITLVSSLRSCQLIVMVFLISP